MNKKQLISVLAILILMQSYAFSYVEQLSYRIDLNNDGKKEIITRKDNEGSIIVSTIDNNRIDSFSMPNNLGKIKFISLNRDSTKQIVAWSYGGAHYTNLAIYGLIENKLVKIFEAGSDSGIEADFESNPPNIRVGTSKLGREDWPYADQPGLEVWVWDGNNFKK